MDIDAAMREAFAEIREEMRQHLGSLGREAVAYAKENATFNDVTGSLRSSYSYDADGDTLTVSNTADYASEVEARGKDVLSGTENYLRSKV